MIGLANGNIIPAEDPDRSYIVHPRINQEKCASVADVAISPAMTAAIRRWSGMNITARRIASRSLFVVRSCLRPVARIDLGGQI